ncbi:hypothetical protein [Pararobbsia silviterrae]|uniref:Porin n=1 Tax=Pararobbsia silviterrae TaxID=1792498 RepID=A0A494Y2Q8_9BURK|nr:hypothetical protein [Pararobbsia silviterrae]RKP56579.1 hypothetical protein D7S86_09430 [Pararobbsia silviterrae]
MFVFRGAHALVLQRMLVGAGVFAVSAFAHAQSSDGPGVHGAVTGNFLYSDDSDSFQEERTNLGYMFSNGWGIDTSVTHFSSPGWSATGAGLFGLYREHDAQQTVDAKLGVMDTKGETTVLGSVDYMRQVTSDTGLGVSAERDVVDSIEGLDKGLTYTSLALVLDHQFTPRFSVGAVAGAFFFSDNNTRPLLKTRWNYELIANSGLNFYIKTWTYSNSNPNNGDYYAPRWLNEYSGGLSWRTALGDKAVFFASADVGRQNSSNGANNIWGARIGLENHRSRAKQAQWQIAVETTNDSSAGLTSGGGAGYRYTSVMGRVFVPLN